MNSIAAQIVAAEPAPSPDFLRSRRSVSVVMVVYMTGEALEQSLACVLADPLVDELVVVDNGSTPAEAERLRALDGHGGRVRLLTGHGNVGFAKGANLGAAKAKGDLLVFLNPDAFLQDGCIAALAGQRNARQPLELSQEIERLVTQRLEGGGGAHVVAISLPAPPAPFRSAFPWRPA